MKTKTIPNAELFERALKLLVQTRVTLSSELCSRKVAIERGNARGVSWTDLRREIVDLSWS